MQEPLSRFGSIDGTAWHTGSGDLERTSIEEMVFQGYRTMVTTRVGTNSLRGHTTPANIVAQGFPP